MRKPRAPKEPVKPSNIFRCCDKDFDGPQAIKDHLKEAHDITELKGTKSMVMHLDCADSYSSTWEWKVGGVTFAQFTTNPRQKNDLMRFGE